MKYPKHTITQPLSTKQAKVVDEAIRTGKPIVNAQYARTIQRLVHGNSGKTVETHAGKHFDKI